MSATLPRSIVISAWLNAWRCGDVTSSDCANALEVATGELSVDLGGGHVSWLALLLNLPTPASPYCPALAVSGDPCGLPVATADEGVALGPDSLLVPSSGWRVLAVSHAIIPIDFSAAMRDLQAALSHSTAALAALDTVGSREAIEAELESYLGVQLPPILEPRRHALLERAARIRIISQRATFEVPSSRSQEVAATAILRSLEQASRLALCASVTY